MGGVQLYAQDQAIFLRTAATGPANLIVESNTGGANDGEVICNYGFQNLSDEKLKHNVEPAELEELQQLFDAVAWTRRSGSSSPSITTACAASCGECARGSKPAWRRWRRRGRGGVAPDKGNGGGGALEFFRGLAEEFNVRDARKLYQIARRDHPERRDLTAARARAALRTDVARQVLAPKPRSLGKSAADSPNDRLQANLIDFKRQHVREGPKSTG